MYHKTKTKVKLSFFSCEMVILSNILFLFLRDRKQWQNQKIYCSVQAEYLRNKWVRNNKKQIQKVEFKGV